MEKEARTYQTDAEIRIAKTARAFRKGSLYTLAAIGLTTVGYFTYSLGKEILYDSPRKLRAEADLILATTNAEAAQDLLVKLNPKENDIGNISPVYADRLRAMIKSNSPSQR